MATDPYCPPLALDAVMGTPTAKRLVHLSGMSESDMATDLSSLIVVALAAEAADRGQAFPLPRAPVSAALSGYRR
jgi:hypothetical protein